MTAMIKSPNASRLPARPTPMNWLREEIDRLFDDFPPYARGIFDLATGGIGPVPAMELVDRGKAYHLTAELPGLTEKDVTVELSSSVLIIAGKKTEETEHKEGGRLMTERRYGSFRRQFELPGDADPNAIEAKVKHGVLTIKIGKDSKKAPLLRKIEVQS